MVETERLDLVVFGAGGMARELAAWVETAKWGSTRFRLIGFVDDPDPGRVIRNRPVMHLSELAGDAPLFVVALGEPGLRERVVEQAESAGLRAAPPLIHPAVDFDREGVRIGDGTVICPGTTLTTDIEIGRHVQINLHCTVTHDVRLHDFTTLAPGVHISGRTEVGRSAFLGTGAVTVDGEHDRPLLIGENAVVGAGAVVTQDVPANVTVVGVPAKTR
jgi:sugar O-acyltransferase (sialic acid O-acetyltransferase NeuD family)